jgi:hypothetical protein
MTKAVQALLNYELGDVRDRFTLSSNITDLAGVTVG